MSNYPRFNEAQSGQIMQGTIDLQKRIGAATISSADGSRFLVVPAVSGQSIGGTGRRRALWQSCEIRPEYGETRALLDEPASKRLLTMATDMLCVAPVSLPPWQLRQGIDDFVCWCG